MYVNIQNAPPMNFIIMIIIFIFIVVKNFFNDHKDEILEDIEAFIHLFYDVEYNKKPDLWVHDFNHLK